MCGSIYVVLSKTPYKMGGFIRTVTHSKYNHVSIAFDSSLEEMYSFARYHKSTPLYGGFVRESSKRYLNGKKSAIIKVCKIPLTDEQLVLAKQFIVKFTESSERCLYNMLSILCYPFRHRVLIPKCFTCVEFALEFFKQINFDIGVKKNGFCSTSRFMKVLSKYEIYSGEINDVVKEPSYDGDRFYEKVGFFKSIGLTFSANGTVIKRLFTRKKKA